MSRPSQPLRGIAWMAVATLAFAAMTLCARVGTRELPWIEVALARSAFGWAIAVGVAKLRGASLVVHGKRVIWVRTLLGTGSMLATFYLYGQPELPLGDIAAIGALTPVLLALLAPWVLGEASTRRIWVATPLAFAGVLLLVQPSFELARHLAAIALFSATISAGAMLALRRLTAAETPEGVAAHFASVATLVCLALALPTWSWPDASGMGWLLATGALGGLGQITMTRAYALDSAARVGTVSYLGTVLVQVLAVVLLDEATSPFQVVGSAMVLASGLFLTLGALRDRAASAAVAGPPAAPMSPPPA